MSGEYDETQYPTSWRDKWQFTYKAATVAKAAHKMAEYHEERIAWWESESEKAENDLKEKGFEYRSRPTSRGEDVQIVGDPELAKRVSQYKGKIENHKEQQNRYSSWVRALTAAVEQDESRELTLTISDVLFFQL